MNYYPSRAWHVIALPSTPVLLAFAIGEYIKKAYGKNDPFVNWFVMLPLAIIGVGYIVLLISVEIKYITEDLTDPGAVDQVIEKLSIPDLNHEYSLADNSQINWDVEKNWANALIREAGLRKGWDNLNLTEDYWKGQRWLDIGGRSLEELRSIKVRWSEQLDALERTNPNAARSSYRVRNPQTISRLANGDKVYMI